MTGTSELGLGVTRNMNGTRGKQTSPVVCRVHLAGDALVIHTTRNPNVLSNHPLCLSFQTFVESMS